MFIIHMGHDKKSLEQYAIWLLLKKNVRPAPYKSWN